MAKVAASHLTPDPKRIDLGLSPAQVGFAKFDSDVYLSGMPKSAFEPCIPTPGKAVPDRPEWLHEIKHDGYRLIVQRDGKRVRLFTRNGHDWSKRDPLIVEAALRNRNSSFVIVLNK
jgi:ATP-dependent DNA ligase